MIQSSAAKNWAVFLLLAALTAGCGATFLTIVDLVEDNIRLAVRHSAQFAFVIWLVVILTRPLQQLLRKPWTAKLLRNRRLIGVAFAGAMTGHLALIIFRFTYTPELTYPLSGLVVGGGAYALIYLMFITSFDGPARLIGPKVWKLLHRTGLIWFGAIFAIPRELSELTDPEKLKFTLPVLAVITARFIVWRRSKRPGS
jgi:DMSO/TMAO reductase YedYZ heme-binding membrane subunit